MLVWRGVIRLCRTAGQPPTWCCTAHLGHILKGAVACGQLWLAGMAEERSGGHTHQAQAHLISRPPPKLQRSLGGHDCMKAGGPWEGAVRPRGACVCVSAAGRRVRVQDSKTASVQDCSSCRRGVCGLVRRPIPRDPDQPRAGCQDVCNELNLTRAQTQKRLHYLHT